MTFLMRPHRWAVRFNIRLSLPTTCPLRPVIPDNARGLCITAAAGTELATPYSPGTVKILPWQKQFTTRRPSSCTRRRSIRLSPIVEYSRLLPPVGVRTVLSFVVEGRALTPPTRHSLGGPLPRQQADRTEVAT